MGRYISVFALTILLGIVILFVFPLLLGDIVGEPDIVVSVIVILFGSFIITQLFYVIDFLHKNK